MRWPLVHLLLVLSMSITMVGCGDTPTYMDLSAPEIESSEDENVEEAVDEEADENVTSVAEDVLGFDPLVAVDLLTSTVDDELELDGQVP